MKIHDFGNPGLASGVRALSINYLYIPLFMCNFNILSILSAKNSSRDFRSSRTLDNQYSDNQDSTVLIPFIYSVQA